MLPVIAAVILAIAAPAAGNIVKPPAVRSALAGGAPVEHKVYGFVQSLTGNTLVIRNRTGQGVVVDGRLAHTTVHFFRGRPVIVFGTTDAGGVMHANAIWRTFPDAAHWPADR